ncbi:MAG: CocE/NonD family hydrolase, partial [Actinomycetota bacterium]
FPSSDGITMLHADVLRPVGMSMDVPTPVIMTVSPYTNHSGSTSPNDLSGTGPSPRFYDFLDLSGALDEGYTYVMVDLPGDGGSAGCNDWGGVREQAGVRAAVEWAAEQDWSNGRVALLGKSYDGWTGLMGIAQQPEGLAAVVSLEPVYSGYRYIYMNGVRRTNWPYGLSFTAVDAQPGRPSDSPEYHANGAPQAWCYPINIAGQNADHDENGPYWAERNLVPTSRGKTTPLFLTQGFLERNTKADGAFQYFNDLSGDENRAWYGQFDHCRAWETQMACDGEGNNTRLAVGREGFIDEVMRFLDEHLKGIEPEVDDPPIEVQDNLGRWRAEQSWPAADARILETELRAGTYADGGSGRGDRPTEGQGMWSISEPLAHDVWYSGTPHVHVSVEGPPNANLAANVYDIAPDGRVTMIDRGVQLLRGTGIRNFSFTLYGQDWLIEEGHRIGVLLSGANTDQFSHLATRQPVTIRHAKIGLYFLTHDRTEFLSGGSTPRLESFLAAARASLSPEFIESAETPFVLPPPLQGPADSDPLPTSLALEIARDKGDVVAVATLTQSDTEAALGGREISFLVNGEPVGSVITEEDGTAELRLHANEFNGHDVLRVFFAGTDDLEQSSAEGRLKN